MRRYTCSRCRGTCRCGQKQPTSATLIWPVLIGAALAIYGIGEGVRALYRDGALWPILVIIALIVLIVAFVRIVITPGVNSPEIRERERNGE